MNERRVTSFRNQRVIATMAFFFLAFVGTTFILWGHIDNVLATNTYGFLAKMGLLLVPVVGLILTCWELFVDDVNAPRKHPSHPKVRRLVNWCFVMSWAVLLAEVVHSGAILKFESSIQQQAATIKSVSEGQAQIVGAATSAAITSSGEAAQKLNNVGQTRTARRTIASGKDLAREVTGKAQEKVQEAAAAAKPGTFLPDWYVNGGMYAALPSLAVIILALTMAFARAAQPYVDKDDDGRPDYVQDAAAPETELPPAQKAPATFGFGDFANASKPPVNPNERTGFFRKIWGESPRKPNF